LVQGRVGAGENTLNYGISLANSQITGFSAAESGIRDANMATEAANLTKAQVLEHLIAPWLKPMPLPKRCWRC